jgi:two-component system, OmpR family, response regulator
MKEQKNIKLFLVDDDLVYLKLLEIELRQYGIFKIETYTSGEDCIKNLDHNPDLIILDYHLDSVNKSALNGIETLDKIKSISLNMPVVILSAQDKIEVAVDCLHHQAFDYVVKSETTFTRLQKIISSVLDYQKMRKQLSWYMERM